MSITIKGIGVFLPETIRKNDYWSRDITDRWMAGRAKQTPPSPETPAMERTLEYMAALASDPFQGAIERRVMDESMLPSEMEASAARDAMSRAGFAADEIDFVLVHSVRPDFLNTPNACAVHEALGLDSNVFSLSVDGMCNAFLQQLHLAKHLIDGGRRKGLLIQSSNLTSFAPREAPFSPWFGDGATAVCVGAPSREGHGLIADTHKTDSSLNRGVVFGVPEGQWFEEGRVVTYVHDRERSLRMLLTIGDMGQEVVGEALSKADLAPSAINFYASHQANPWFRPLTQEVLGLANASAVDTFSWAGSLSAANIPLVLATGEREGALRSGDLVAMYSGGSGITYSGAILRWGD